MIVTFNDIVVTESHKKNKVNEVTNKKNTGKSVVIVVMLS